LLAVVGTVLAALLVLLGGWSFGLFNQPNQEIGGVVQLSGAAPNFTVTAIDGKPIKLSDLRGKVVVLNFWGSWCVPCQDEAPDLAAAYQQFQGQDVVFVGIAWADQDSAVRQFVQDYHVPYRVALDDGGKIAVDYGITGVPETFVIDQQGRFTKKWVGPVTASQLGGLVDPLLH
jgi:peroxiredoxin